MIFVKSHIPSRSLNDFKIPSNIQIIPFEKTSEKENGWLHELIMLHPRKTNIFSGI